MATVTVTVTLRRTEGRTPVDVDDLADAVASDLLDLVTGSEISASSVDGEDLVYEITRVHLPRRADIDVALATVDESECRHCGAAVANHYQGRRRQYCSDACRQAAYRIRSDRPAHDPWGTGTEDGGF
jgi:ferredoxin